MYYTRKRGMEPFNHNKIFTRILYNYGWTKSIPLYFLQVWSGHQFVAFTTVEYINRLDKILL